MATVVNTTVCSKREVEVTVEMESEDGETDSKDQTYSSDSKDHTESRNDSKDHTESRNPTKPIVLSVVKEENVEATRDTNVNLWGDYLGVKESNETSRGTFKQAYSGGDNLDLRY